MRKEQKGGIVERISAAEIYVDGEPTLNSCFSWNWLDVETLDKRLKKIDDRLRKLEELTKADDFVYKKTLVKRGNKEE
jgi:hypothetical protein